MRWDALFSDLEAQLGGEHRAALDAEVADRVRIERGTVTLVDRLRGHGGTALSLDTGTVVVRGRVLSVGSDFVLVDDEGGGQSIVPTGALVAVAGLGRAVGAPASPSLRRLGLAAALRGLVRDRAEVRVVTRRAEFHGVPAAVGADHLDLSPSLVDLTEPGRIARQLTSVPLAALLVVRSR